MAASNRFGAEAGGDLAAGSGVGDDAVDRGLAGVEVAHPGLGEHGDVGVREDAADGAEGRERHHGVADPVGRAHTDPRHRRRVEGHLFSG